MKNFHSFQIPLSKFLKALNLFGLTISATMFVQQANAQALYKTVAASQVNITSKLPDETEQNTAIKSEGNFVIKDGVLDDISSFKFVLPNALLKTLLADSLIKDKDISFVQTNVMVLPLMGMVHFVGMLNIGGEENWADFQLAFTVNNDQSITFKGTKVMKLSEYMKQPFYTAINSKPKDELTLKMNFVLKNSGGALANLGTK